MGTKGTFGSIEHFRLFSPPFARAVIILLGLLSSVSFSFGQAEIRADLFHDAEQVSLREVSPTIAKRRSVRINETALQAARTPGAKLLLNLFPENAYVGIVDSVHERGELDYTLAGHLEGEEFSSFVLVAKNDVVVINIRPGNEGLIQVRYVAAGLHEVQKVDERQFPPCETGPEHAISAPIEKAVVRQADPGMQEDTGDVIDVMVVYTQSARNSAGGTSAIEALVAMAIAESNTAYGQSMIMPRLRLAHVGLVNYTESSSFSTDLDRLTNPTDGFMDEVHTLRNTHAADMVSLWVNNSSSCGIAFLMTTLSSTFETHAFSTVHYTCATGYYSFGHELGHNMGCTHNRENASGPGLNPYSYGWRFFGTNGLHYRTIMAYEPGTRIQRFSNPDVNYFGTPTGVPIGNPNEAHNAQTINNSAFTVANFRQAASASGSPIIVEQPLSRTVYTGASATFSVNATGASPLTYRWRRNGNNLAGATTSTYTITNAQLSHAGSYSVIVSNAYGSATSTNALLTVSASTSLATALDNHGFLWLTNGNGSWVGQFGVSFDGADAAESGAISHAQQTSFETTVEGPGTLTFRWKVSSESLYDYLRFYLNGSEQTRISGEVNWQQKSISIPAGPQNARWSYTKDGSVHSGQDKGWVDQVVYIVPTLIHPETAAKTNGQFRFHFTGTKGGSYTIYASSNLTTWHALTNFVGTNSPSLFVDPPTGNGKRFYKVGSP